MKFFEQFKTAESMGSPEGRIEELAAAEKPLIEGAVSISKDRVNKNSFKAAALATAFSIFMGASTAFASGERRAEEVIGEPSSIEFSLGAEDIELPKNKPELISIASGYPRLSASEFYRGLASKNFVEILNIHDKTIRHSNDAIDFFQNAANETKDFSDQQKAIYLQNLGNLLSATTNYDMLENNQHVKISDDAIFQAIKKKTLGEIEPTGICGNIHIFLTKTANNMGIESWLQSGFSRLGGGHIWSGMILENNGEKQITFLNYGDLIPTGTLNYRDALGVSERALGALGTFGAYAGDTDRVLFPVKSRGQEVEEKAVNVRDLGTELEDRLANDTPKNEAAFELQVSPETQEMKLNQNSLGLALFHFQDFFNDPYQSLSDLDALRGNFKLKGESTGLEATTAILHMNVKDLNGNKRAQNELISILAADYIDSHNFTKGETEKLILNWGAIVRGAIRLPLEKHWELMNVGASSEGAAGARVTYIDPTETTKFYIGAVKELRVQFNNFESQDLALKEVADTFTVGSSVKVNAAQILNLEAVASKRDWGDQLKLSGKVTDDQWSAGMTYEKNNSDYERFVPSAEKIAGQVGYREKAGAQSNGPQWEVNVLGFKNTLKYMDAAPEDSYGAEVKLRIFLW